jgi:uncharacterized protein YqfA (UPF0365 family)
MSVYSCTTCGSTASTLAACSGCGAVVRTANETGLKAGLVLKLAPFLLAALAVSLAVPPLLDARQAYDARVAREQAESERLLAVEREKQHSQERQLMVARADSVLRAIPRSKIRTMKTQQLSSDQVIVGWRSDSLARRWVVAATKELKARAARKSNSRPGAPSD